MCSSAGHVVEVVLGGWRLGMVFPLAQDRLSFLGELGARTASLEGLRTVALVRPAAPHSGTSNAQHYTILHYTILQNATLYYTTECYIILYYNSTMATTQQLNPWFSFQTLPRPLGTCTGEPPPSPRLEIVLRRFR